MKKKLDKLVMRRAAWNKEKRLNITQVVQCYNVSKKKIMALNKLVHELAGLELCQFEVKKKKTFCECAGQLILNNREKLIRQRWKSRVSVLLSFQLNDVLHGSIDEEERNRRVFGNRWQDRSGNLRLGHSASTEEENEQRTRSEN